jgi:hypothetical protein
MGDSHLVRIIDNTRLTAQPMRVRKAKNRSKAALQKASRKTNRKRK